MSAQKRLYALGRLKTGAMNKTESAYAEHLELRRRAGEVAWFKFEGIKLRLADNCFLTVDFAVMLADGRLELHDAKGSKAIFSDDAKVKMKTAAELYPFVFKVAFPQPKKLGGGWLVEEIGA
ncbi:DUF1064 domain-containing protein [uncultured Pseudomonas sp.]|uniref:DUF1064 domain-containing protein n=1 Tax=uncultured Pseudomonas sp. TaxID=114707 RepID=UPI0025D1DECF|nr:DUF1064 domain-containing protein [uncultured Pseudomonas sp.]